PLADRQSRRLGGQGGGVLQGDPGSGRRETAGRRTARPKSKNSEGGRNGAGGSLQNHTGSDLNVRSPRSGLGCRVAVRRTAWARPPWRRERRSTNLTRGSPGGGRSATP